MTENNEDAIKIVERNQTFHNIIPFHSLPDTSTTVAAISVLLIIESGVYLIFLWEN